MYIHRLCAVLYRGLEFDSKLLNLQTEMLAPNDPNCPTNSLMCEVIVLSAPLVSLKGQASISVDDLETPLRRTRNHHSEPFQVPYARTEAYEHSFFPETVRDWNALPASVISSAECSEDCISRFTSLMRSRD